MVNADDDLDFPCFGKGSELRCNVLNPGTLDKSDCCPEMDPIRSEISLKPVPQPPGFTGLTHELHGNSLNATNNRPHSNHNGGNLAAAVLALRR